MQGVFSQNLSFFLTDSPTSESQTAEHRSSTPLPAILHRKTAHVDRKAAFPPFGAETGRCPPSCRSSPSASKAGQIPPRFHQIPPVPSQKGHIEAACHGEAAPARCPPPQVRHRTGHTGHTRRCGKWRTNIRFPRQTPAYPGDFAPAGAVPPSPTAAGPLPPAEGGSDPVRFLREFRKSPSPACSPPKKTGVRGTPVSIIIPYFL